LDMTELKKIFKKTEETRQGERRNDE
jgi:hypothetical protein